jgi:hypothetical protein
MDLWTQLFLIALMVITYLIAWKAVRPLVPKLGRWVSSHRSLTEIGFSLVLIVWGAGVWYLIVTKNAYSNIFAIVMASILICAGVYFLAKQLLKKA